SEEWFDGVLRSFVERGVCLQNGKKMLAAREACQAPACPASAPASVVVMAPGAADAERALARALEALRAGLGISVPSPGVAIDDELPLGSIRVRINDLRTPTCEPHVPAASEVPCGWPDGPVPESVLSLLRREAACFVTLDHTYRQIEAVRRAR